MAVTKEILTLAVETGDALLRNGAEVYRVEDTVLHILKAYETDIDFRIHGFEKANENGYKVETTDIQPGIINQDDRVTVEAFPVSHGTLESYGFKFTTPDKVLVISADTAPPPFSLPGPPFSGPVPDNNMRAVLSDCLL